MDDLKQFQEQDATYDLYTTTKKTVLLSMKKLRSSLIKNFQFDYQSDMYHCNGGISCMFENVLRS